MLGGGGQAAVCSVQAAAFMVAQIRLDSARGIGEYTRAGDNDWVTCYKTSADTVSPRVSMRRAGVMVLRRSEGC